MNKPRNSYESDAIQGGASSRQMSFPGKIPPLSPENIESFSFKEIRQVLHDLHVNQIELEMQNMELRTMQANLDAARARYFDLYDLAPVGYCTISDKGMILESNLTAATLLGLDRSALLNQPLSRYVLSDYQEIYYLYRKQLFETGKPKACELQMVKNDGTTLWAHLESNVVWDINSSTVIRIVMSDITERKQNEEALRNLNIYNRTLIEASLDAIVTIDSDGRISDVNSATEQVTGYPRQVLIGTDFSDYFTEPETAREGYQLVFKEGMVRDYPLEIRCRDGYITPVMYNASVYHDYSGKILGVFASARDVTGLKQAEEQIRRFNAELEQRVIDRTVQLEAANKELEAFCYSVSHDLRAPLRHIDGYVELLVSRCRDGLTDKGLHYLDTIADSARQMGILIDDLLQFSRTGRQELRREILNMNQVLQEALSPLREINSGRTIEWVIADLPPVRGDYAMLRQVWANLLGNAVKYTRPREIAWIEVSALKRSREIIFVIKDNGVGFDMQYVSKLFGVFQRLHSLEEFEGTGIGLATVQRIISRHGGRVWVEAELNQGATFYFTLPRIIGDGY